MRRAKLEEVKKKKLETLRWVIGYYVSVILVLFSVGHFFTWHKLSLIYHVNCLLADNLHDISSCICLKIKKNDKKFKGC